MKFWKRLSAQQDRQQDVSACCDDARQVHAVAIEQWLDSALGQSLCEEERAVLKKLLPQVYSPVAIQIVSSNVETVLSDAQSALRIRVIPVPATESQPACSSPEQSASLEHSTARMREQTLVANPMALPFAANSVDLIVASHTLDMVADPHQVLRELHQVLQPEGHLIIVGFNPVSLWGGRRLLSAWRGQYPWNAGFLRLSRIKDWLRLLGFDITSGCLCHYSLPVSHAGIRRRFQFLEPAGKRWWPGLGGVYILVARKRDLGITPIGLSKRRRRRLAPQLAAPVTRRILKSNDQDC